jgi:hypothetical protein
VVVFSRRLSSTAVRGVICRAGGAGTGAGAGAGLFSSTGDVAVVVVVVGDSVVVATAAAEIFWRFAGVPVVRMQR